jgi:pimeloyl-ACP methyl ester carboxylesterase
VLNVRKIKHRHIEAAGVRVFYREAGLPDAPAVLLLHGFPSSSHSFRDVMSPLAEVARVVAPDLPGFGFTRVPDGYDYTFEKIAHTIDAFTKELGLERFFLYVHDFGAPVAYHLALDRPERVLGLIIQNGNAHEEGLGEAWDTAKAYFAAPTPENRAALPDWLNFEGTRAQYVGGAPAHLEPLFAPESWHLDWERLRRPGLVEVQFRIFADYARHIARFPAISAYHRQYQPPALLLWGRHDTYFQVEEVLAYGRELDRIDMHIFDGSHLLLETHHQECAALMRDFILDVHHGQQAPHDPRA